MSEEQKTISDNIGNYHPENPIVFEMQRRYRELEKQNHERNN